jgi:hypothetical protein
MRQTDHEPTEWVEWLLLALAGLLACVTLGAMLYGLWRVFESFGGR